MKADRRHELKENDLLHMLETGRARFQQNKKAIYIAVSATLGAIVLISIVVNSRAAAIEDRWRRRSELKFDVPEVNSKDSLKTLAELTDSASDEVFVITSLLEQGRIALHLARKAGPLPDREFNEKARATFQQMLGRFKNNPLAFGVAHSGLATAAENDFVLDGNLAHKDTARQHLNAIIDNPAMNGTPFARMAVDRRAALDLTFTKVVFAPPAPPAPELTAAPATSVTVTPIPAPPVPSPDQANPLPVPPKPAEPPPSSEAVPQTNP